MRSNARQDAARAPKVPAKLVVPIAFGTLLQALNSSMIAVALVGIRSSFHAGASVSWLISGLYLATAVGAPLMGRLADILGPRKVFFGGLAIVAISSVLAPFAPNIGVLIALRVLLGIGTAAPYPAGIAMIRAYADRHGIGNAVGGIGVLAIAGQVAVALGPPLGGLLVQFAGWQSIFLVNLPLIAVAVFFAVRYLPADEQRSGVLRKLSTVDGSGLVLFTATMSALMLFLLSLAETPQWYLLPITVLLGVVLFVRERAAARPFLDLRLLTDPSLRATYARTALTYVAFYLIFYGMPSWLESGRGLDTGLAGLVMLPLAALGVVVVTIASRMQRRNGIRPLLVIGSTGLLAGACLLALVARDTPLALLFGVAAVLGLPNGFNSIGNQSAVYAAAPAEQAGAASGLYRTSQYIGANIAAAVIELAQTGRTPTEGMHVLGYVVAGIGAVLLVTAVFSRQLRGGINRSVQ
ncbi:MFS transporter [Sciscionella marina]|uniref:MFS transporter n=1 Tax=Sciscionella marina TaxID=508770 RepID=UPI00036F54FD|nr:MFS transporter [Sciscionella marina]